MDELGEPTVRAGAVAGCNYGIMYQLAPAPGPRGGIALEFDVVRLLLSRWKTPLNKNNPCSLL